MMNGDIGPNGDAGMPPGCTCAGTMPGDIPGKNGDATIGFVMALLPVAEFIPYVRH